MYARSSFSLLTVAMMLAASPVALAGVQASSHMVISSKPAGTFAAPNLVDSKLDTVWIEGADDSGIGESFTIDLPRCKIKQIMIFPGHGQDERMFGKYAHLKEVSIAFFSIDNSREVKAIKQQNHVFEDAYKFQAVPADNIELGGELFGGQVKVTIRSVYPGKDFLDTAVAEVRVVLDEWPAQKDVSEVSSTLEGSSKDNLLDGSSKTAWIAGSPDAGQFVKISAPDYGLSAVLITPGAADPKSYKQHARPKDIVIRIDNHEIEHTLTDSHEPQRIDLPTLYGYTGSMFGTLEIVIKSVYPGTVSQNPSIGEIDLLATNFSI